MRDKVTFFLVTTDHLSDRIWFKDDEDFKAAMNYIAAVKHDMDIIVLAFILMSNHIHVVLGCTREEAFSFITSLKRRYGVYYGIKYGAREFLRRNGVAIQALDTSAESLERAIAYVQMNCVAANICHHPSLYRWGTGRCFFRDSRVQGTRLETVSARKQYKLLHLKDKLPGQLILDNDGYIAPESYVSTAFVESLFRTPGRYSYFLQNSSKAKRRLPASEGNIPSFRDQSIISAMPDLCNSLFGKSRVSDLSEEETAEFIKQLRRRFSADVSQIGRITGLSYKDVVRYLDIF